MLLLSVTILLPDNVPVPPHLCWARGRTRAKARIVVEFSELVRIVLIVG